MVLFTTCLHMTIRFPQLAYLVHAFIWNTKWKLDVEEVLVSNFLARFSSQSALVSAASVGWVRTGKLNKEKKKRILSFK